MYGNLSNPLKMFRIYKEMIVFLALFCTDIDCDSDNDRSVRVIVSSSHPAQPELDEIQPGHFWPISPRSISKNSGVCRKSAVGLF